MKRCLELAQEAALLGEVPVGALILQGDTVVAESFNQKEKNKDATAHAEVDVIRKASQALGRWRLSDCTLVVTLEPCIMCAGAILSARIPKVCFGTWDPKGGAFGSLYQVHSDRRLNHQVDVFGGVSSAECSQILKDFFNLRRSNGRSQE